MSEKEILRENPATSKAESLQHNALVMDAYNFCADTVTHPEARSRQAFLAAYGATVGGMKNFTSDFANHPWEIIGKATVAGVGGVALGAALASESPVIAGGATVAGVVGTAAALWHTYVKLSSNEALKRSLDSVYKSGDQNTLAKGMKVASNTIGPEAVDYGIAFAGGLAGMYGSKAYLNQRFNSIADELRPFIPLPKTNLFSEAIEMPFKDGSSLHIHGKEAIYKIGGLEQRINVGPQGIDMDILGSSVGKQVLKGWHSESTPWEASFDPQLGITTVKSGNQIDVFKQSVLKTQTSTSGSGSLLCGECNHPDKDKLPPY